MENRKALERYVADMYCTVCKCMNIIDNDIEINSIITVLQLSHYNTLIFVQKVKFSRDTKNIGLFVDTFLELKNHKSSQ